MGRTGLRVSTIVCCGAASILLWRTVGRAISLDEEGDMKLGVRTYVNARVGTESTHDGVILGAGTPDQVSTSATFPHSDAGHLRQNRFYIEAELNHDLSRLVKENVGPFSLINDLPFKVKELSYHLTFRGEGEGLYDWGPNEYSTAVETKKVGVSAITLPALGFLIPNPQVAPDVAGSRHTLRKIGTDRERLFQASTDVSVGPLFVRVGRQLLSWGETDAFQLLDRINPIDNSFGGFLIDLDERRVPLDMVRANYYLGDYGPVSEAYLEGFAAVDNKVGYFPGTPEGSAWTLPSLGAPSNATLTRAVAPARTINNTRGGFLLKFNAFDATFSLAHYYTYFDTPAVQVFTNPNGKGLLNFFPDGYPTHTFETAPKVQVSGGTTTFAIPQIYGVLRSEVAYFKDEPAFTQKQLDPFFFQPLSGANTALPGGSTTGGRRLRDSINAVLGLDVNQWIRFLNPNQTFLMSTQFFYKHIKDGAHGSETDGNVEVLPIELDVTKPRFKTAPNCPASGCPFPSLLKSVDIEPLFIRQPIDQYLQTFFIGTSYRSGTVNPSFTFFYDWGGGLVYQPSLTLSRDPFRFIMDYSILDSHIYKGGSGVSLLKDRDNVEFRFEYVI